MSLGENIFKVRKKMELTQEQLGEIINVSRQTISNWELGETSPNLKQLKLLSKTLNISIDELLNEDIDFKKDLSKTKKKMARKRNMCETMFLILGSPIWISLLIAIFSIVFSIYIALWAVIASFWATFITVFISSFVAILFGFVLIFNNNNLVGLAMIGAGFICVGLLIFIFYGCKASTNGILILTKKIIFWIKKYFSKKEVS